MHFSINKNNPPVAIGGVGGSGTRLIADCLKACGYNIGSYLNESTDNLYFTLLFKRFEILTIGDDEFDFLLNIFIQAMFGKNNFTPEQINALDSLAQHNRRLHNSDWLQTIVSELKHNNKTISESSKWGWKEPNTHMVLDKLLHRIPNIKYIHVMRNGFDMAHSRNQNQLIQWGKYFIKEDFIINPYYSLRYWCAVHKRIIQIGKSMGDNFMLLNYDEFCSKPTSGVKKFSDFVEATDTSHLKNLIKAPASIGRFKQYGLDMFDAKDVDYVHSLGFTS